MKRLVLLLFGFATLFAMAPEADGQSVYAFGKNYSGSTFELDMNVETDRAGDTTLKGDIGIEGPNGNVVILSGVETGKGRPSPDGFPGTWYKGNWTLSPQECELLGVSQGTRIRISVRVNGSSVHALLLGAPGGLMFGHGEAI